MARLRTAVLLLALAGLTACTGSVSSGAGESGGSGGEGGSGHGGSGHGGSGGSGGSGPVCETPPMPQAFELGTGEKCFSRVAAGDEVPLMNGPQGGYHMWLSVGCEDCANPVHLKYGVRDPATQMPLPDTYDSEAMVPLGDQEWPQAAGLIDYMPGLSWDPEGQPPLPKGTHVVLWVEAYGAGDAPIHQAEVEIVVGDVEEWNPCIEDPDNPACNLG